MRVPGRGGSRERCAARQQKLYAEINQVGRTNELQRHKEPFRRSQQRPQAQGRQQRVTKQPDAHAGGRGHAGTRALAERLGHDEDHVLPRRCYNDDGGDEKHQPMGFDHGPEEEVGGAVSDAELTDSRVRADGTKLVGLVRLERQLRVGSFGYLKDAIGSGC